MKPVRVDFVAPFAWQYVWSGLGLTLAAMLGVLAWQVHTLDAANEAVRSEAIQLQARTKQLRTPVVPTTAPKEVSAAKTLALLRFDMNKVFSTLENVKVADIRLTAVTFDMASGSLTLEYALQTTTQAQAVTDALNAGYEARPWRLNRVESTTAATNAVSSQGSGHGQITGSAKATWQASVHNL